MSAIAVLATYAISLPVRTAWDMPFDWLAWIDCLVIPVAMPVAGYIFWQSERMPIAASTKPSGGAATMSP